ncbi:hypothetical protein G9U51_02020 [Calidifontibacter sp. DB0510]|uniref:Lipoprotein LpqB beta-propeller domain-containing protein n=1 Tax=Metallococcus carri TaxID=1656884 RepID=A0A967EDB4_9MICO|nr:GerMN domain-containing protein [Metallococcus carri]NHN54556.1 hypothetical protein [Metallococcus carri]NOP36605.1 hypothetical protein [Calidifontibacter sp. DB2511S]
MIRRWWLLVLCLLLAGCGGLPSSSRVSARDPIMAAPTGAGPRVEFYGPQGGENPVELVTQFLRANSSPDDDYGVAREFLTPGADRLWVPGRAVALNNGERDFAITSSGGGRVRVVAKQTGELDGRGHLTEFATPRTRTFEVILARVGGEWRISELPKDFGAWIGQVDFTQRLFLPRAVYYPETTTRTVVPERLWFPKTGLATALARAVLAGPPPWMAGGPKDRQRPAFVQLPADTALSVDAVPVDAARGMATVDLTTAALRADAPTRAALWAAMTATLIGQVDGVQQLRITAGGNPWEVQGARDNPTQPSDVGYQLRTPSGTALVMRDGNTLRWVDPATGGPQRQTNDRPTPRLAELTVNWYLPASDAGGHQVFAISGSRTSVGRWKDGVKVQEYSGFARQLVRPSADALGEMWFAGLPISAAGPQKSPARGSVVWTLDSTQSGSRTPLQAVAAPWLATSEVLALRVATDAQRVAVVTRDPRGVSHLFVSTIARDRSGNPVALTTPMELGQGIAGMLDAAWIDDESIAVLARSADNAVTQAYAVPLSGFHYSLGQVPGGIGIVGTGVGVEDLVVVTNRPSVLTRAGASWPVLAGYQDAFVPGR